MREGEVTCCCQGVMLTDTDNAGTPGFKFSHSGLCHFGLRGGILVGSEQVQPEKQEPTAVKLMSVFSIFAGKPQHPLADPREAKEILADLATREPQSALEESVAWLEALAEYEDIKLPLRIERLVQLEDVLTPQIRRLARTYIARLAVPESRAASEARLWDVCYNYWSQLAAAYATCLSRFDAPGLDSESKRNAKSMLAHIGVRMMHALAEQRKWEQFQYKPATVDFWGAAGGLYSRAVAAKMESRDVELYPGQETTTIELEYLKALLLQSSSPDKLALIEIELADRLLSHFLPWFIFTKELRRDNMYWVDISKPLPPTRMAKVPEPSDSLRFFSGGGALAAIAELIDQINHDKKLPTNVVLGAQYDTETVLKVLAHLSLYWSPTPPTRSHTRRPIRSSLSVAHGLTSSHQHVLGQPDFGKSLYRWEADDISLGGMSARIREGRQDWINIGVLLVVQPEGGDNWIAGVVRRYVRYDARQGAVGIQTLSRAPRSVVADAGGIETAALLLDMPVVGEYARMALPPAALEDKVALKFSLDDMNARFHPREVLERGPGYVVANFFVQSYS